MKNRLYALPLHARRALALRELRRRGVGMAPGGDNALGACFQALRAGIARLPDYVRFSDAVCALSDRIDTNLLTTDDKLLLSSLPSCSLSPAEVVQLFAGIEREF